MLKRVRWLVTGAAIGAGGSVWAKRKAKATVERYAPPGLLEAASRRLRGALADGRTAMREREAELKGGGPASQRSDGNVRRRRSRNL